MKKIFFKQLLAALLLFTSTMAGAQTFHVDGFYYTITDETEMTVELKKIYEDYYGEVIIPSTVIYDGNTYNVTSIGEKAFNSRSYITTVTIPDGITNIGAYAFANCTRLTNIKIPGSVTNIGNYAFSACKSLAEIIIPEGVTHIGKSAFDGCTALTTVTIPTSVKVMIGAFGNCTNIKTVNISDLTAYCNIELIDDSYINSYYGEQVPLGSYASSPLYNHVYVENDYEHGGYIHTYSAPKDLVLNGEKIVNLVIPADVHKITGHFLGCSAETISFEERDETTGDCSLTLTSYTFSGMGNLKKVTLPDFDVQLGIGTFMGCTSLEEITIGRDYQWAYDCRPDRVYYPIGFPNEIEIFLGCTHLKKLTTKEGVTRIPDMFGPRHSYAGKNTEVLPIDTLVIPQLEITTHIRPQTIDYLNEMAWYSSSFDLEEGCNALIAGEPVKEKSGELVIPEGTKRILDGKVSGMGITKVTLPNSLTHIHYDAFANCTELKEINIPENVTFIGKGAFDNTAIYNNCTEKLLYIDNWLVAHKGDLGEITIKEGTKGIADRLFEYETSLTGVTLPTNITRIDGFAFSNCPGLKSVTIPSTVTGIGESAFSYCSALTDISIPGSVTSIGESAFSHCSALTDISIPGSVTSIGESAFSYCSALTDISIPGSVTSIGDYAFGGCESLEDIKFTPDIKRMSLDAFMNTAWYNNSPDGLLYLNNWLMGYKGSFEQDSLIVKEGTTAIADYTSFRKPSYISLPKSLLYIGKNAIGSLECTIVSNAATPPVINSDSFYDPKGCTVIVNIAKGVLSAYEHSWNSVKEIVASCTVGNFEYRTYTKDGSLGVFKYNGNDSRVKVPAKIEFEDETFTVKIIGQEAFCGNTTITEIDLPDSIEVIEANSFKDCTSLAAINIPSGITGIEEATFSGCTALPAITIPNGVTTIDNNAFYGCVGLAAISIPNSVEYIGSYAFNGCSSLTEINLPKNIASIETCTFQSCTGLQAISIPDGVDEIQEGAFDGCTGLKSIEIPNSVRYIKSNAFYKCSGLERVTIGNGIEEIKSSAFRLCSNLKKVEVDCAEVGTWFNSLSSIEQIVLGKNVQSISRRAFYNTKNTSLKSVTSLIPAETLFKVTDLIKDYSICTLYVQTGTKETYAATDGWNNFANIVEMDLTGIDEVNNEEKEEVEIYDLSGRKIHTPSKGIYIINGKKKLIQ